MSSLSADFSTWIQGMLCIICIYHLSTYFFTKDKDFLLYAIFVFLVGIFSINLVDNAISKTLYTSYKVFFDATFWIVQVLFWLFAGWFYLGFLNLKEKAPKEGKFVQKYLWFSLIINISVFLIDYLFFNQQYYLYFDAIFFVLPSFFLVLWIILKLNKNKSSTIRFFELANFILIFAQIQLMLHIFFPEKGINFGLNPNTLFLIGVFINIVIISVGLGYKYQIIKLENEKINLDLINELNTHEKLRDELNNKLYKRVEEASLALEIVAQEAEELKLAQIEANFNNELEQLKFSSLLSHMNSHFLFNSLNSIKLFIIENKKKEASFYLTKFSKLIRKMLDASMQKETTLTDELETIKIYTNIENIRFENEIIFNFEIDKNLDTDIIKVPPFILHPFIENAIWHGISPLKGEKKILITLKQEESFVCFIIEDNGVGRKASSKIENKKKIKRTSFGIEATKERLKHFYINYEDNYELDFSDKNNSSNNKTGTRVTLKLPLK